MRIANEAPIVAVSTNRAQAVLHTFAQRCRAFGTSLQLHGSAVIQRPNRPNFPITQSANDAADLAEDKESFIDSIGLPNSHLFAYMLGDTVVGIMLCSGDNAGYEHLESLACNPGLSGCAGALIEHAVALSISNGREGKVSIFGGTDKLVEIYQSYGFILQNVGAGNMVLNPLVSTRWALINTAVGQCYRLLPRLSYIDN